MRAVLSAAALGLAAMLPAAPASAGRAAEPQPPLVALDVGHSHAKPGAISARGIPEFEFNLALARRIEAELAAAGIGTRLIGADGRADNLFARSPQAAGTRLLLAIHHDSVQEKYLRPWQFGGETRRHTTHARGWSLYVSRRTPQEAASLACAAAIGRSLAAAGLPIARHHRDPATGKPRPWADHAAGVHYYDNLIVLRTAEVPAVLLEAGVILHREEEELLGRNAYRTKLARRIVAGIRRCL
ncbi:N-acetylmuramoyl-L-alanine amidase [Rhodocyclaceae bacterium]|nr:N-acetylmuramoyl-L-alanine amidase [Rhodocyclaceae bacterium]